MGKRKTTITLVGAVLTLACPSLYALEALNDTDLAAVSGQDGLTVTVWDDPAEGVSLDSAAVLTSNPDPTIQNEAGELGIRLSGQNGQPFIRRLDMTRSLLNAELDVGADAGVPVVYLKADWARSRMEVGAVNLAGYTSGVGSGSFGHYAVDSQGAFELVGRRFLDATALDYGSKLSLNIGNVDPSLWAPGNLGAVDPGAIYWRQGGAGSGLPEMTMSDFSFYFNMPDGRYGLNSEGLLLESKPGSQVGFSLSLDFRYDAAGLSPFATTPADKSMLYWGWRGHWQDFQFALRGTGGRPDGSGKGLNAGVRFNYTPDFIWAVGEGGENPAFLEFGNWTTLPGNPYGLDIPFFAMEALDATGGLSGLCWGNGVAAASGMGVCANPGEGPVAATVPVQPVKVRRAGDPNAMGFTVRDMRLAGYSTSVNIIDHTVDPGKAAQPFQWALVYTLADLDAELFLSPHGDSKSMRLDAAVTSQTSGVTSADRWLYGSNFMIGDSLTNYAIGLMEADVLGAVRGGRMGMTENGLKVDAPLFRYQLRGMLGGGSIPDMAVPQFMAYVDANVEADRYVLNLGPAPLAADSYLAYSGFINLANLNETDFASPIGTGNHSHDDGTYLSLSEPDFGKLGIDFRFADITGPIEITDGRVDLQGDDVGELRLMISNNLRVGTSARVPCDWDAPTCTPAAASGPLQVGRVEFGGKNLGTVVMPSGIIRSQITLMPQVP